NINNINICSNNPLPLPPKDQIQTSLQKIDLGTAPDLKQCDRTEELATLENWVIQEQCRLVSIIGLIGIGKTTLTRHLVGKLQPEFETIIWRSFCTAPTLEITLKNLLICLSGQTCQELPVSLEEQLSMLMEYLRTKRCLIIFDGVQTLLNTGTFAGQYHPIHKNYSLLLKLIAETSHQSCLIINSWEIPQDIVNLTDDHTPVRYFKLPGLSSSATQIFCEKRLQDEALWQKLIHTYQGNPLWLRITSSMIQNIFRGKVSEFLQYENLHLAEELSEILKQHFERLSSIEIRVIKTLSQAMQPLAIAELIKTSQLPATEVFKAIQSLERRCLIETEEPKNITCFTVTPIIKKYIMEIG
ncbi:MAG: NB-ARC domain-containing protein, partial [Microcoleaceae cyanobacterium]